ncbi:MAG: GTPase Era [Alphaproteobacteria bacterium]
MTSEKTACGFACIIGLPNAGKSTLVNGLVGEKVSIVSRKTQTTRSRVLGIVMQGDTQIVLVDTPGIFTPKKTMERAMVQAAWSALDDADVIIHLVDASDKSSVTRNDEIIEKLPAQKPCLLVMNKTDQVNKPDLFDMVKILNEKFSYAATFMISALKKDGISDVLKDVAERLPQGPWLFDPEQTTDMPMRLMASEITREKIFDNLHEELPYAVFVETESWEDFNDGSVKINQLVYVRREGQKAIVLGKGGSQIKMIGQQARREMETLMGCRVHLKLFVKVREDWPEREEYLRLMGLETPA